MTHGNVRKMFRKLNVWRRGGARAPHIPLLVLYALARMQRETTRFIPYREIDTRLVDFLREFGSQSGRQHPEHPFRYLTSDGVWEVKIPDPCTLKDQLVNTPKSYFLKHDACGGFTHEIFGAFKTSRKLVAKVAEDLLNAHFPSTLHEDVLQAVGLEIAGFISTRRG